MSYEIPINRSTMTEAGKVASFCRDFDMDFSNATGIAAYISTGFDSENKVYQMSKMNYVPSRTGTNNDEYHGVIVRMESDPSGSDVYTYRIGENDYNSATTYSQFKSSTNADVAPSTNRLVGVVANTHVQGMEGGLQNWGLSNGKWQKIVNRGKLTPYNRAYLQPTAAETEQMNGSGSGEAKVAMVFGNFSDFWTTDIDSSLQNHEEKTNDSWYSIDGRRLQGKPTQKGIYINNGKKEIIK